MPSLLRELAVGGARKSDGSPVSSGRVFLYSPGTTTVVAGYTDNTLGTAHATVGGGIALDAGGRVTIYINDVVDVVVTNSSGGTVNTWLNYNATRAEQVEVENDGYTGAITKSSGAVSQGLGGETNLDTILTRAFESLGPDFKYLESTGATSGATSRPYIEVIRDLGINVRDFGARGDGVAIDTTAIQLAMNRAKSLSVPVLFPKTSAFYKINQALTLSSSSGVSFLAPRGTVISQSHATASVFSLTGCSQFVMSGLYLRAGAASTGTGLAVADCFGADFINLQIGSGASDQFAVGMSVSGTSSALKILGGEIHVPGGSVNDRCIRLTDANSVVIGGNILLDLGSGVGIEYAGSTKNVVATDVVYAPAATSSTAIKFTTGLTGTHFTASASPTAGDAWSATTMTTPFDLSGLATDPDFRQWGNNVDGYVVTQASGGGGGSNHTPNRARGREVHVRLTSGGAAVCTINAATPVPRTTMRDVRLTLKLTAAAGGNITWTFPAVYVLVGGGTTIVGTDGNTDVVEFMWDVQTSEWRECFRSATAT